MGGLALAWLMLGGIAAAGGLALEGPLVQGGLVRGAVPPGTEVRLDGRAVRVSPAGDFVIGFGRDAGVQARLRLRYPDGTEALRRLAVGAREFPTQRIDGLPPQTVTPDPATAAKIREQLALIDGARRRDSAEPWFTAGFAWPLHGPITGLFGSQRILNGEPRRPHSGIDIAAPAGTPVRAAAPGVVALVHRDMVLTGKTVVIDHGHGLSTIYVHLSEIAVAPGAVVGRGQPVGRVGATGRASGPHLHWGVHLFATALDPALVAGPMPAPLSPESVPAD